MRFLQSVVIAAVAAIASVPLAGTASAHGSNLTPIEMMPDSQNFTGAWPITITNSQHSNGNGCLTLKGSAGSGQASLVFGTQKYPYGSFIVMHGILMVTMQQPLYGQNGALMFVDSIKHGQIVQGIFEDIEGGSNFDVGTAAFGTKNGC